MTHYLALTIGPVQRTIRRARKTRELWAASFLMSQFMKELLQGIREYGEALSPDIVELNNDTKHHGAGIWNDNCFFRIHGEKLDELKENLPGTIQQAKKEIVRLALYDLNSGNKKDVPHLSEGELTEILFQHFHCHAVLFAREANDEKPVLIELGKLLKANQMREIFPARHDDFVNTALFRGKAVSALYDLGFEKKDTVFTFYKNRFDHYKEERRLPSLLEIGVREFKGKPVYQKIEDIITEKIKDNDDLETDEENQAIIRLLKDEKLLKKRHKYVAIVQSDGDGVGTMISEEKDEKVITTISKELMAFSTGAAQEIFDFDALPVYAGGDDLLFIAPLQNKEGKTVFNLIDRIQEVFQQQETLIGKNASLSFGVSVFYYKYPLGESLEAGRDLLNKLAKKLAFKKRDDAKKYEKKGLAFRFMLHSGQSFAAVLRQDGTAWDAWKDLLKTHNSNTGKDTAFVAGVVHTLESLGWLLDEACQNGRAEHFFKHHFNEAENTPRWAFIKTVEKLAVAIYSDYQQIEIEPAAQNTFFKMQLDLSTNKTLPNAEGLRRQYCNNLLYAALRTIKFLNDPDHE